MKAATVALLSVATVVTVVPLATATARGTAPPDEECAYEDPDFGLHTHELDIDNVRVSRSQRDPLSFAVAFSKDIELAPDTGFQIAVDTDSDRGTGDPEGFELFFSYVQGAPDPNPRLNKWEGGTWTRTTTPSLAFSHEGDQVTLQLDADELPPAFSFQVGAGTRWISDDPDIDWAPQREHVVAGSDLGVWTFPACGQIGSDAGDKGGKWVVPVIAGIFGLGAMVAVAGWTIERIRRRSTESGAP